MSSSADRNRKTGRSLAAILVVCALAMATIALSPGVSLGAASYSWTRQASGTTEVLSGVSALDANHAWAVGRNGTIRFFDGSPWTSQVSGTANRLNAVSALNENQVWAVGASGTILYFNGTTWAPQASGTTANLFGVFALNATHVWAVGTNDTVCFYNGSSWNAFNLNPPMGARATLFSVTAVDASHVWAVGNGRLQGRGADIFFYNGSTWTYQMSGAANDLYSVSALDANHVWAVGQEDIINFFNGSSWSPSTWMPPLGTLSDLFSVSAFDENHVWAVGNGALDGRGADILMWDGGSWNLQDSQTAQDLNGVSALDADHVWAVGTGGLIEYGRPSPAPTSRTWGHESVAVAQRQNTWYLAEGSTGAGFETWITVQNSHASPADVTLTYMTTTSEVPGPSTTVPANSRMTFNVADTVPDTYEVSTRVTADRTVVAERSMYGNGRAWGHDSIGISTPQTDWYLAEGSTGQGFETWVLVQNPNPTPTQVTLTYMTTTGEVPGPTETLAANTRKNFEVSKTVQDYEVSTRVHASQGVVAERAMYGNNRTWGTDSIGASTAQPDWYLAEGSTGPGFETWIVVQNPGATAANIVISYMTGGGGVPGPSVAVQPGTRRSFEVSKTVQDYEVSTMVHSDQPVVVERAMYGSGKTWGHDSIGVSTLSGAWFLAEGTTGPGFETWVTVQNPNPAAVEVTLTYMTSTGEVAGPAWSLLPNTRKSFNVADVLPGVPEISTRVTATGGGIVAERSVYGDPK